MLEQAFIKALINAGVGAAIAVVILVGLYRIARGLGEKFIEAEHRQAEAMGAQAQSVEELTRSLSDFMGRDSSEHREILVLLRFIAQQQKVFEEVRVEHDIRKEQAHPRAGA
ncbi:MAG: hypothetical protein P8Y66_07700 [Nitrospirota bacterium]|jgi:hypothetical protein